MRIVFLFELLTNKPKAQNSSWHNSIEEQMLHSIYFSLPFHSTQFAFWTGHRFQDACTSKGTTKTKLRSYEFKKNWQKRKIKLQATSFISTTQKAKRRIFSLNSFLNETRLMFNYVYNLALKTSPEKKHLHDNSIWLWWFISCLRSVFGLELCRLQAHGANKIT